MSDVLKPDDAQVPEAYFTIARLADARFSVELIKRGSAPRKSYSPRVADVVKQLVRAGRLPVQTDDEELQRACRDQQIELLPH